MIIDIDRDQTPTFIGRVGDNRVNTIRFPIGEVENEFPGCTFILLHQRAMDPGAYPVPEGNVEIIGEYLYWTVTSGDTAQHGKGEAEVVAMLDDKVANMDIYGTIVEKALSATEDPPEPWEGWVTEVVDAANKAEAVLEELKETTAQATTLPEGSDATADYTDGVLTIGVPKGDKGDRGE